MTKNERAFPDDRTASRRRMNLSAEQLKELALAGGVEGGMRAGSAGGPTETDARFQKGRDRPPRD